MSDLLRQNMRLNSTLNDWKSTVQCLATEAHDLEHCNRATEHYRSELHERGHVIDDEFNRIQSTVAARIQQNNVPMATYKAPPIDMSIFDCRQTVIDSGQHSLPANTDMTSSTASFANNADSGCHGFGHIRQGQGHNHSPGQHGHGHENREHGHQGRDQHGHQQGHGHTFQEHGQHGNGQHGHGHEHPENGQQGHDQHGHQQDHGHGLPEHGQHGSDQLGHWHEHPEHGHHEHGHHEHDRGHDIGQKNGSVHDHKLTDHSPSRQHRSLASTELSHPTTSSCCCAELRMSPPTSGLCEPSTPAIVWPNNGLVTPVGASRRFRMCNMPQLQRPAPVSPIRPPLSDVTIKEIERDGKFIVLINKSCSRDEEIGCCVLQQKYQGHAMVVYRFPSRTVLTALGTVTVWSGSNRPNDCDDDVGSNVNLLFRELGSWGTGSEYTTTFCRPNGEIIAWGGGGSGGYPSNIHQCSDESPCANEPLRQPTITKNNMPWRQNTEKSDCIEPGDAAPRFLPRIIRPNGSVAKLPGGQIFMAQSSCNKFNELMSE